MAGISDEDIQKVREASDLVAIAQERTPLRQRGRDFWCCCPFHQEKTPSCKIDPNRQLWHCFGCGEGGDVFSFVMKAEGVTFPDAVRSLADRAHIELAEVPGAGASRGRKARLKEVCEATAAFYHLQLMRSKQKGAADARAYLASRGLGGAVPKKWLLGFAPGSSALVRHLGAEGFKPEDMIEANVAVAGRDGRTRDRFYDRVMFPIRDVAGDVIAFGGRVVGAGEPKYLNSQETPLFHKSRVLYGLDQAKSALVSTGCAIVVEGYTDVIALHEAGIANVVATLGTALTESHIRLIGRFAKKRIVYLFDGDAAGQRAADRALAFIDESMTPEAGRTRIELFAVTLPDDKDPADFVAASGAADLEKLVGEAQPLVAYGIERRLAASDLSSAEGRTRALASALSVLAPIKDSLLAKDYARQIAGRVQAREADVLARLGSLKAPAHDAGPGATAPALPSRPGTHARPAPGLSEAEESRRRFERELLSLCAQEPALALAHADALAQTAWHDSENQAIADALLDALARDPRLSASALIAAVQTSCGRAASVLTSARVPEGGADSYVGFLVEELAIGDMEDAIASLRARLAGPEAADDGTRAFLFESAASMQKTVNELKRAHRMA